MRPNDLSIESSRDILRKIEENTSANIKLLRSNNKYYQEMIEAEKYYLALFLDNNKDTNYLTNFQVIQKIQNLNLKW